MNRRAIVRVLAVASLLLACLAMGVVASPHPADAAGGATPGPSAAPVSLPRLTALTAGQLHDCGLADDGRVWCWGGNVHGTLGVGSDTYVEGPVVVQGIPDRVTAISAGTVGTCALTVAGGVWCWGDNEYGQMGDATGGDRPAPVRIPGLDRGVAALAGRWVNHVCVVMEDGSARCWGGGTNDFAALGNGANGRVSGPVTVTVTSERLVAITAGLMHTCALTVAGGVLCWGNGLDGQLGHGEFAVSEKAAVVPVGLDRGVRSIAAGDLETCALKEDGSVWCWGNNQEGQLGDGTTTSSAVPVAVKGLPGGIAVVAVSTTIINRHACALADDGVAFCWGSNGEGELGDGTQVNRLVPVAVKTGGGVSLLAVGGNHGTAFLRDGSLVTWGDGNGLPSSPFGAPTAPSSTGYRPTGPLVPAITTNIPTPADISTDPPVVGANLLLAAIAMIAFTIAIELFNRTLADAEPLLRRRLRPLEGLDRARARVDAAVIGRLGRIGHPRLADALRILGIAAFYGIVFALLDPTWDPLSVTGLWLVLSFAIACGLVGMSDDLASWVAARRWGVASELSVRPGSLLAAVGSTVATRVLVLVPGVIVGVPEALEIDEEHLDRGRRGRLAAAGLGAVGIVGAVAWLVTLAAGPLRTAVPGIAVLVGGLEAFLLLVFAVAVQNGFVQLLAFRNSAGRALLHVNRIAWGIAFLAVTFVFWHTLVNPRGDLSKALGATNVQAFLATVGIMLAVAAGAWVAVRMARRREALTRAAAEAIPAAVEATVAEAATTVEAAAVAAGPAAVAEPPIAPEAISSIVAGPAAVAPVAVPPPPEAPDVPAAVAAEPAVPGAPAAAPMAALRLPAAVEAAAATLPAAGPSPPGEAGDLRIPCPRCAEAIRPAARVCRFCGLELATAVAPARIAAASIAAPPVVAAPVRAAAGSAQPITAAAPAAVGAQAVVFALRVSSPRRMGGPVRLVVAGDRLELHAGWVAQSVDRFVGGLTIAAIVSLAVLAVPVLSAIVEPGFRFYRVPWLLPTIGAVVLAVGVGLVLLRVWHDRRRRFRQTSCPLGAVVRADTVVDANAASIATVVGLLVGGLLYVLVAGRTVVRIRAPLDPEHGSAVEIRLRAHDRDEASDIARAILDARARAVPPEVVRP